MRTTSLLTLLFCGILLVIAPSSASSLPGASARLAAKDQNLGRVVEKARTRRPRQRRRARYRRPYYAPYFCSRPYQYRYWMFYAPICYPL